MKLATSAAPRRIPDGNIIFSADPAGSLSATTTNLSNSSALDMVTIKQGLFPEQRPR